MKEKIHPRYYQVEVRCACGNVIKTGSTRKEFSIAVCSNCHPFYTGAEKLLDAAGRVERFQKRFAWTDDKVKAEADKPKVKAAKGAKPSAPVESRARGSRAKTAAAAAPAGEGRKKESPKAAEAKPAEPPKLEASKEPEPKKLEASKEPEPKKPEAKPEPEPKAAEGAEGAEKAAEPKRLETSKEPEAKKEAEPKAEAGKETEPKAETKQEAEK